MNCSVAIKNVSKSYGKNSILDQISLSIEEGQIYGFIGPSGAGKTTLVKIIVGMELPDQGSIQVLNKEMPNLELFHEIGYMAQSDALYQELTGKENLKFFGSLYKMKNSELKHRIAYVAELVNLTYDLNKKVSTYSGGMKRRLSLAIALIQNPKVLILDEPTVGIDPELRFSIWAELERIVNDEGKTIIITTHVMDEAERCNTVAMVRDGKILAKGTPQELKDIYQVRSLDEVFLHAGRQQA